jgi:hypothetical protein
VVREETSLARIKKSGITASDYMPRKMFVVNDLVHSGKAGSKLRVHE